MTARTGSCGNQACEGEEVCPPSVPRQTRACSLGSGDQPGNASARMRSAVPRFETATP